MGIMTGLLLFSLMLARIALELLLFFLVVRLIVMWRSISWLMPYDQIGTKLVNGFVGLIQAGCQKCNLGALSARGQLIAGIVAAIIVHDMVIAIVRALSI